MHEIEGMIELITFGQTTIYELAPDSETPSQRKLGFQRAVYGVEAGSRYAKADGWK